MLYQVSISIETNGQSIIDITDKINFLVDKSSLKTGICQLFIQHTSAALLICEHADPNVLIDLETIFNRLIPDNDSSLRHIEEGGDDMSAHARTVLTKTDLTIPVSDHRLLLGVWQGIFLWEHRQSAHNRKIIVTLLGETF